ncbi:hypothetical protein [Conexibacter sp. SYSU D00693]|uniref:hypothetical protein n=1 Tax=Conexibacter sp. SYSU D00693 TaxID=2812560 RepID=UPI00196B885B|nr:hypothetical protein [Conexibacter sp. SYSU D00693]
MLRRPLVLAFVALFLLLSAGLARFLSVEGQERDAIVTVLEAQARGDVDGVLDRLTACDATCAANLRRAVPRLAGPGDVKLVRQDSATSYALGSATGTSRVVWVRGPEGAPVVQCFEVRREGSALAGRSTSLLRLSAPLRDNEDPC